MNPKTKKRDGSKVGISVRTMRNRKIKTKKRNNKRSRSGIIKLKLRDGDFNINKIYISDFETITNMINCCDAQEIPLDMSIHEFVTIFANKFELLTTKEQFDIILDRILYLGSSEVIIVDYFRAFASSGFEYTGPAEYICYICARIKTCDDAVEFAESFSIDKRERCIKHMIAAYDTVAPHIDVVDFLIIANADELRHYVIDIIMVDQRTLNDILDRMGHSKRYGSYKIIIDLIGNGLPTVIIDIISSLSTIVNSGMPKQTCQLIALKFIKNINQQYDDGNTIAHLCANNQKVLKLLIDIGYDITILNNNGQSVTDLMLKNVEYCH